MPEYKTANKYKTINRNDVKSWIQAEAKPWVKALMIFLYFYGLRISEALRIERQDLYTQEGYLWLIAPETALLKNQDPYPRRLPIKLDSPGMEYLLEYLENLDPDERLFPYSRVWAWASINKIDTELSPHVFRHNRATEFFLQDASEVEVQAWLGHSDTRQSSKYRHKSGIHTERLGKKTVIL